MGYLNAFQVDVTRGVLTVPRVFLHDDINPAHLTISRETLSVHRAPQFAGEVEEIFQDLDRYCGRTSLQAGAWKVSSFEQDHFSMGGPGGRHVELRTKPNRLTLRVGYSFEQRIGHDRQLHYKVDIGRPGYEPTVRSSCELSFGSSTYQGLLEFLGVPQTTKYLEWMSREKLWAPIRKLLESDGYRVDLMHPYRSDHHGLSWTVRRGPEEALSGYLWLADEYPMLQFDAHDRRAVLPPSFEPLWKHTLEKIRSEHQRALPAGRFQKSFRNL